MQNRGVLLDGISWSANVAALASGHQWEKSLKVAAKTISTWDGISSAVGSTIFRCLLGTMAGAFSQKLEET